MPSAERPPARRPGLLLLSHTAGFGGGVERVADAVCRGWDGPVARVDAYERSRMTVPVGRPRDKVAFALRAVRAARRERPGVVLSLDTSILPVAAAAARAAGAELALYAVGREAWSVADRPRRALARRCSRVLAISTFTAEQLPRTLGVHPRRVVVTPLPIEPALERAARRPSPHAPRAPLILTVGRITAQTAYKGHADVARSLPAVLARVPDARWIVIGDGDRLADLRGLCSRLGVLDCVELRGAVPDDALPAAYRSAAVFAMPSVTRLHPRPAEGEGFGLVYAEAAAFGVPSVASTASGGAADLVRDGVTGLCVPPGDPDALAEGISRLLTDGPLRDRLGAAARAIVLDRHTDAAYAAVLRAAFGR